MAVGGKPLQASSLPAYWLPLSWTKTSQCRPGLRPSWQRPSRSLTLNYRLLPLLLFFPLLFPLFFPLSFPLFFPLFFLLSPLLPSSPTPPPTLRLPSPLSLSSFLPLLFPSRLPKSQQTRKHVPETRNSATPDFPPPVTPPPLLGKKALQRYTRPPSSTREHDIRPPPAPGLVLGLSPRLSLSRKGCSGSRKRTRSE